MKATCFSNLYRRIRDVLVVSICVMCIWATEAAATTGGGVLLSEAENGVLFSRFSELARHAQSGTARDRAEFTVVAMDVVIASYLDEIDKLALERTEDPEQRRRQRDWRAGTLAYVADLRDIVTHVDTRSAIAIISELHGAVRIVIDGRQVIIGGPRLAEQDRLEEEIARSLCNFTRCRTTTLTVTEKVEAQSARLQQGWVFEAKAPPTYATSDGLNCVFRDRTHIKLKQTACESLLRELRLLAEALKAVNGRGFPVHWQSLDVGGTDLQGPHRITYDRRGRFFQLRLPALYKWGAIWRQAVPWIKASVSGKARQHYIKLPEDMVYLANAP